MEHHDAFTRAELRAILTDLSLDPDLRVRVEALLSAYNDAERRNAGFTAADGGGEQADGATQQERT